MAYWSVVVFLVSFYRLMVQIQTKMSRIKWAPAVFVVAMVNLLISVKLHVCFVFASK